METILSKEEILEKIAEVSSFLEDEQSRKILEIRNLQEDGTTSELVASLALLSSPQCRAYNREYLNQNSRHLRSTSDFDEYPFIFYGAGNAFTNFPQCIDFLEKIGLGDREYFFCDRRAEEIKTYKNRKVITPEELFEKYSHYNIVINSKLYGDEICENLILNGISKDKIFRTFLKVDLDGQYFDDDIIQYGEHEVFVDAGVYNGDTSVRFANHCQKTGNYDKIFLFEANVNQVPLIETVLERENIKNHKLFACGLWHQKDTLRHACVLGAWLWI